MFRKLVLAATLALGMGGGLIATQGAEAAVAHPAPSANLIQAVQHGAYSASRVQQASYYHGRHRVCRVRRVRVHTYHGWRWVNRRVCWWR
jgi:hypothetical protein